MPDEVTSPTAEPRPTVSVAVVEELSVRDMHDLADATEAAILAGGGFGWVQPPMREALERYWRGVLMVPERTLVVGRLDGVVAGSAQLQRPTRNNEAQAHAAHLTTSFVAPWARGHGLARLITQAIEELARGEGFRILNLDVRETQTAAIALYEAIGYRLWGVHPAYARVGSRVVAGRFYYKELTVVAGEITG